MDNGSRGADQPQAQELPTVGTHDESPAPDVITPMPAPDRADQVTPEAMGFLRPHDSTGAVAAYAKQRAQQSQPSSVLAAWASAAQLMTAPWAVLSVAVAGAYIWAQGKTPQLDRLVVVAVAALALIIGVNLLRGAARDAARQRVGGTTLPTTHAARASLAFLAVGVVGGFFIARWLGVGGSFLGLIGLALVGAYAILPGVYGAAPGDELIPAMTLGPGLFYLSLGTQQLTTTITHTLIVHGKHTTQSVTQPVGVTTHSTWLLAFGLGALFLAPVVASRLRRDQHVTGMTTLSFLGVKGMRYLLIGSIIMAYLLVILSGLPHSEPHATLAVLLSLPAAVVPLTGALRARNQAALYIVLAQTQRLVIQFALWLLGGLVLAGIYMHYLASLHIK